ncbi:ATPase, partial [Corallococcus sp. CA054B]
MTDFFRRPPPGPGPSSPDAEQDDNRSITPLETPAAPANPVLSAPPRPRTPPTAGMPLGGEQRTEPTRSRAAQPAPLPSVIFDPMPRPRVPPAGVAPQGAPPPFTEEMLDVQTERRTAPPG